MWGWLEWKVTSKDIAELVIKMKVAFCWIQWRERSLRIQFITSDKEQQNSEMLYIHPSHPPLRIVPFLHCVIGRESAVDCGLYWMNHKHTTELLRIEIYNWMMKNKWNEMQVQHSKCMCNTHRKSKYFNKYKTTNWSKVCMIHDSSVNYLHFKVHEYDSLIEHQFRKHLARSQAI